jgi:hypothetical protein
MNTLYDAETKNVQFYCVFSSSIKLYPPLAQPIIERALWHGCGEARGVMMEGARLRVCMERVGLAGGEEVRCAECGLLGGGGGVSLNDVCDVSWDERGLGSACVVRSDAHVVEDRTSPSISLTRGSFVLALAHDHADSDEHEYTCARCNPDCEAGVCACGCRS